jgi:hypothetical protein
MFEKFIVNNAVGVCRLNVSASLTSLDFLSRYDVSTADGIVTI